MDNYMDKYTSVKKYLLKNQYNWLITGVAGFIGSNLLEELLLHNQVVIGLDNFATGYKRNLDEVLKNVGPKYAKNFHFYEGDICNVLDCEKVMNFSKKSIDFVLHQAALGSVPRSIENPAATHTTNITGFLNVLISAKNAGVKRFVYASSSSVYGDSPVLPKIEKQIGNPLSPYAVTKFTNELYAKVFSDCYGIETIGLRYFNVFGSRQDPNGAYAAVIPLWVKAMLTNDKVYINGDGETTRDFCYVRNAVQANILSAITSNSKAVNQVYNVACGDKTTLNQLFFSIRDNLNISQEYQPVYRNFRAGDIRHSLADITSASELLEYSPSHRIADGLQESISWYKNFFTK